MSVGPPLRTVATDVCPASLSASASAMAGGSTTPGFAWRLPRERVCVCVQTFPFCKGVGHIGLGALPWCDLILTNRICDPSISE